jgi:hypothetical protein
MKAASFLLCVASLAAWTYAATRILLTLIAWASCVVLCAPLEGAPPRAQMCACGYGNGGAILLFQPPYWAALHIANHNTTCTAEIILANGARFYYSNTKTSNPTTARAAFMADAAEGE